MTLLAPVGLASCSETDPSFDGVDGFSSDLLTARRLARPGVDSPHLESTLNQA